MIKKNNEQGSVETMLIFLIFSLVFSSVVISFILLQSFGYQTTGNEAPIIPPGAEATMGIQDYTTNTISDNYNYEGGWGDYQYQPGVGRVLVSASGLGENWLLLKEVAPVDNTYTTTYKLNNSVKGDYAVVARFKGTNPYDIVIRVRADGFHIRNEFIPLQEYNFYPYTNANQFISPVIKTIYTVNSDKTASLQFYFNNNLIFTKSDIAPPGLFGMDDESIWYHAGVGSQTVGFTVESITVAGFNQYSSTDILSQIGTFLEVLAKIILWNVNPAFLPWEINLMLIKTQLAGIVICVIVIVRG